MRKLFAPIECISHANDGFILAPKYVFLMLNSGSFASTVMPAFIKEFGMGRGIVLSMPI